MLDSKPRKSRFNMQAILGFLLGVVASLLWMFFAVFVGGTLGPRHTRMYPGLLRWDLRCSVSLRSKRRDPVMRLAWHSRLGSPFCCWLDTVLPFTDRLVHRLRSPLPGASHILCHSRELFVQCRSTNLYFGIGVTAFKIL